MDVMTFDLTCHFRDEAGHVGAGLGGILKGICAKPMTVLLAVRTNGCRELDVL
jgi:hypothetical protein